MEVTDTSLEGLYVITTKVLGDARGFFVEAYRRDVFLKAGLDLNFVQENQSRSQHNVVRGLHFQYDPPLGKLIRISHGKAFMVAVDIRKKSKTFREVFTIELDGEAQRALFVSPGFAVGFAVTGEVANVVYHYTAYYNAKGEANIFWNDPALHIPWPVKEPILSERDMRAESFAEWLARPESNLL